MRGLVFTEVRHGISPTYSRTVRGQGQGIPSGTAAFAALWATRWRNARQVAAPRPLSHRLPRSWGP